MAAALAMSGTGCESDSNQVEILKLSFMEFDQSPDTGFRPLAEKEDYEGTIAAATFALVTDRRSSGYGKNWLPRLDEVRTSLATRAPSWNRLPEFLSRTRCNEPDS